MKGGDHQKETSGRRDGQIGYLSQLKRVAPKVIKAKKKGLVMQAQWGKESRVYKWKEERGQLGEIGMLQTSYEKVRDRVKKLFKKASG